MDPLSDIRKSIRNMSSGNGGAGIFTAKVLSTDGDTCCVDIDGLVVSDVRLRAVVNGEESGILVTPKTDSYVTVADLSGGRLTQCVVIGYSEVEKIEVNADDKIIFNGGQNHGLVNIADLTEKLNNIETDINNLKIAVAGWIPVSQDGGAALKTAIATWASNEIHLTQQDEMEDTNITH